MKIKGLLNYQLSYENGKSVVKEIRTHFYDEFLQKYDRRVVHDCLKNYYIRLRDFKKWIDEKLKEPDEVFNYVEFCNKQLEIDSLFHEIELEQNLLDCIKNEFYK